ncbi:hypothetical protein N2152v2_003656 [Parachlorella kessleri]
MTQQIGRRMIKHQCTDAHASLLEVLPILYITAQDASGQLWATALVGQPGFVAVSKDPSKVVISNALLLGGGELTLQPGQTVGCLGLLPSSRRRVRLNGTISHVEPAQQGRLLLTLQVQQAYGNCPKYIQKRNLQLSSDHLAAAGKAGGSGRSAGPLGAAEQALVRAADTFVIASSSGRQEPLTDAPVTQGSRLLATLFGGTSSQRHLEADPSAFGADLSHRGGLPGFVQVLEGGSVLKWGDYEGNFMFNTLGNLLVNPSCSLLFLDFTNGDMLQVTGDAEVLHKDKQLPGAQRAVRLVVREYAYSPAALPLRQVGAVEYSPYNPEA